MPDPDPDPEPTLAQLCLYPVKSCAAVSSEAAWLTPTGLQFDRCWMLVDEGGDCVSQRELPGLARVQPRLTPDALWLEAPGMAPLQLGTAATGPGRRVRVWHDEVAAFDAGAAPAQWFSDFTGRSLRLVRFDPAQRRLSSQRWTGILEAENAFSDGYPFLVVTQASLRRLNGRLKLRGQAAVDLRRFRPNLVLEGLPAHAEDQVETLSFQTPQGTVRLRLVQPCIRCPIVDVDPDRGLPGDEPGRTLAGYRADARRGGAITFGRYAVLIEGLGCRLHAGMTVSTGRPG